MHFSFFLIVLNPSKAFDKIDWSALRIALGQHGFPEHLLWMLECVWHGQTGVVREHDADSCGFSIRGSVRQGCVPSLRLLTEFGARDGLVLMACENGS